MKPIDLPIEFSTLMLKNKLSRRIIHKPIKKKNIEFKKHSITDENENLLQIYNIQSFPTLLLVKNNGNRVKYQSDSRGKSEIEAFLKPKQVTIAERILKEIRERLGFLKNVGLDYLTLSRTSGTLSGGESQRIRLASQIG